MDGSKMERAARRREPGHPTPQALPFLLDLRQASGDLPPGRGFLHVRVLGRPNQRYALLFRDYLRSHPEAAAAYAAVKRCLATRHAADIRAYVDIKDPVCDVIMSAAEEWAKVTSWQVDRPAA